MHETIKLDEVEEENKIISGIAPTVRERLLASINYHPLEKMTLWGRLGRNTLTKLAVALERKMYYNSDELRKNKRGSRED
mgnify:CR=1 FL=1